MTGIPLIIAFVIAIVLMIFLISKLKVHAFIAIMLIALIFALVGGLSFAEIPNIIGEGFSATFKSIGIVIILGALVGTLLEKTGAALKMADVVVKAVGKKHPEIAMLIMGWIVSIPVFCDSGFVILNPIRRALVRRTGRSSVASTVALSMGLYISHCFIPPTPGPIAAYFFSIFIGRRVTAKDEADLVIEGEVQQTYEELVASYGKLPNAWFSFSPIVVPILLMGLSSALTMAHVPAAFIHFLGKPIIALAVGVILGVILLALSGKMKDFYAVTDETLRIAGPILFITAAGGVLGKVIASTALVPFIQDNATALSSLGLLFPFLLSAILKTAQGSSTVALTASAGIIAPLLSTIGYATPVGAALVTIAIGAGAMTVSHANDSYFWVVTNFGGMEAQDGYKSQTLGSLVVGIASIINVLLISLIVR